MVMERLDASGLTRSAPRNRYALATTSVRISAPADSQERLRCAARTIATMMSAAVVIIAEPRVAERPAPDPDRSGWGSPGPAARRAPFRRLSPADATACT